MKFSAIFPISCALMLLLAGACTPTEDKNDPLAGLDKVTYTELDAVIANPERGFYSTRETHSATSSVINESSINVSRTQGRTLYLFEYYLTDYVNCDIAEEYLQLIRNNFKAIRQYGAKALIRFAYSNGYDEKDRPWDATVEQVLRHVAQIKPILQEYADVI